MSIRSVEIPENPCYRLLHCCFTGTPANAKPYIARNKSYWAISSSVKVGYWYTCIIFIQIFVVGPERRMRFKT